MMTARKDRYFQLIASFYAVRIQTSVLDVWHLIPSLVIRQQRSANPTFSGNSCSKQELPSKQRVGYSGLEGPVLGPRKRSPGGSPKDVSPNEWHLINEACRKLDMRQRDLGTTDSGRKFGSPQGTVWSSNKQLARNCTDCAYWIPDTRCARSGMTVC